MDLISAAGEGNLSRVEYLIDHGADIHARNDQALIAAARNGHLPVVEYLIGRGADIRAQNDLALIWAAMSGHLLVIEFLIGRGANVQVLNPEDRARFQHFIPKIITPSEYLQLEPLVTEIKDLPDRFLIRAKRWYVLLK